MAIMFITTWLWLVHIWKYPGMRRAYPADFEKLEEMRSVIIDNYKNGFWEKQSPDAEEGFREWF